MLRFNHLFIIQIIMNPSLRKVFTNIIFGISLSSLLIGCASVSYNQSNNLNYNNDLSNHDTLRGIGYPSYKGVRQKGMVLLGDNYSYRVSIGADYLQKMTLLDDNFIDIKQPIIIYRYPDKSFRMRLAFHYTKPSHLYTSEERSILAQLCPSIQPTQIVGSDTTDYPCYASLQGGIYTPVAIRAISTIHLSLPSNNPTNQTAIISTDMNVDKSAENYFLKQGQQVELRPLGSKSYKNQLEHGVIPMDVVKDAITLPLQILRIGKMLGDL